MDHHHPMMTAQQMGHSPFPVFYFTQDAKSDARQHGHPQRMQQMPMYAAMPTLPATPVYSRPNSAGAQHQGPTLYSNGTTAMTPMASPQPVAHRPTMMLETEICDADGMYYPTTPPLSTSGSVASSPNSYDVLQTPMNPMFSGFEGLKEGFEPEPLAVDWASCSSPPMTPVYLQQSLSQASNVNLLKSSPGSLNFANTAATTTTAVTSSDILSTASCPSLSPSPSPYARSVASEQDVDFCDPRDLTVQAPSSTANPTLAPEFPALAALGDDEVRGTTSPSKAPAQAVDATFGFNPAIPAGLPAFEDFSDLDSEDGFLCGGLVGLDEQSVVDVRRPRACTGSSIVSLGHGSFIAEEDALPGDLGFDDGDFSLHCLPSPAESGLNGDEHPAKRLKKTPKEARKIAPTMNAAATDAQSGDNEQSSASPQQAAAADTKSGSDSESPSAQAQLPPPANRRGRKQSLTEDPSKTFVCDLCNRRFRRQEHLKRHYRSLHTQEKPFECNECGKKFSRSDNLAQHARTHGSGAIVMDLIDDAESHVYAGMMGPAEDYSSLGKVLFQVTADIPGSASEFSSEDGMSDHGKKKRKRSN